MDHAAPEPSGTRCQIVSRIDRKCRILIMQEDIDRIENFRTRCLLDADVICYYRFPNLSVRLIFVTTSGPYGRQCCTAPLGSRPTRSTSTMLGSIVNTELLVSQNFASIGRHIMSRPAYEYFELLNVCSENSFSFIARRPRCYPTFGVVELKLKWLPSI